MTLATLSHMPSHHHHHHQPHRHPHHATSKWRLGLSLLTRKSRHVSYSPTVHAAATEKIIRHSPSPDAVCCEDLTAKEFAQLAGIKINGSTSACCRSDSGRSVHSDSSHASTTVTSLSEQTGVATDTQSLKDHKLRDTVVPHIWDSDFWCKEEPVLTWCRRHRGSSVIQKGRFRIVVGQEGELQDELQSIATTVTTATTATASTASSSSSSSSTLSDPLVVEWKRKRITLPHPASCATNVQTEHSGP